MTTTNAKSCSPQLFGDDQLPRSDWPLENLTAFARREYRTIEKGEESLAASYWRLGHALTLARRHFTRGQWGRFLAEHGIDKTRSSKAMAIYRTFPAVENLAGKSVDAAYKARVRKQRRRKAGGDSSDALNAGDSGHEQEDDAGTGQDTLRQFLVRLRQASEHWVHVAAFVDQEEAAELTGMLDLAMSVLQEIHGHLRSQSAGTDGHRLSRDPG